MQKTSTSRALYKTAALLLPVLCLTSTASAANLFWDLNGATEGAGATPTGTWDLATPNWNTDGTGTLAPGLWTAGETAVFSAGNDATNAFTVTLGAAQTAAGLTIEEGTVSLAGAALGIGTGTVTINAGARLSLPSTLNLTASAGANLNIDGGTIRSTTNGAGSTFVNANFTMNIGAAGATVETANTGTNSAIYQGQIKGVGTTLTKTGSGEFRFQGANTGTTTFSKLVVNEGLFRLGNVSGANFETGFGAAPAAFTPDAVTLNGGLVGASYGVTWNPNRGITLGVNGGGFNTGGASMTVPVVITGPGALTKTHTGASPGTLTLSAANTYTGSTFISTGIIAITNGSALGTAAGNTQVSSGAELRIDGAAQTFTTNEPISIAGGGAGGGGAITIQNAATPTLSGPVTLTADATVAVSSTATGTFTNSDAFTGVSSTLTLQGGSGAGGGGTISGTVDLGTGGLTKLQGGTWTLSDANTYSGATTITAGTLLVNGSITGTSVVDILGTLGGIGTVVPAALGDINLLATGRISPGSGASVGTLNASLSGGGTLDVSLGVTAEATGAFVFGLDTPALSDRVAITGGALEIGGGVLEFDDFTFTALAGFAEGTYVLFDGTTAITGSLGSDLSGSIGGFSATLALGDNDRDLILQVVPEPGSVALLIGSVALLTGRRRRES